MTDQGWFGKSLEEHNTEVEKNVPDQQYGLSKEFTELKHLFMIQKESYRTKNLFPCAMEINQMARKIDKLLEFNRDTGLLGTDLEMQYLANSFNTFKEQRLNLVMFYAGSPLGNEEQLGNMTPDEQELYYFIKGYIGTFRIKARLTQDTFFAKP